MSRPLRVDSREVIVHAINRANARATIFREDGDYLDFINLIGEAKKRYPVSIFDFTLMPNHWHFCIKPTQDGNLQKFYKWLTGTQVKRWHAYHETTGQGHLYQGRYKTFEIEDESYLLQVLRYIERNPVRAGLVRRAEEWPWSSLRIRCFGSTDEKALLDPWPIQRPRNYLDWINIPLDNEKLQVDRIRHSIASHRPLPYMLAV